MPLEVGLWRVDGNRPVVVKPTGVPLEAQLEAMIEADPSILGGRLLLIGRQVPTSYGKYIDLLAIDNEGTLHVLELKRDRTSREVVAQVLDYGSWIENLTHQDVLDLFTTYRPGYALEQAWTDTFGGPLPGELNAEHRLTVVAGDVDPATERIIGYLAGRQVPINVVFFRYFDDEGRAYLARTWLLDEIASAGGAATVSRKGGTKEAWNGRDWYVTVGEEGPHRDWDDGRQYGFISAGGGKWFSRTLFNLEPGARVFACIPGTGYVGVGIVQAAAAPFADAIVIVDGVEKRLAELDLRGTYQHSLLLDDDAAEYVVPIDWIKTVSRTDAVWSKGMFANQNSACRLTNQFTLDHLHRFFGVGTE